MNSKSIISISMHKAGSSIADSIIGDILAGKGMAVDRIETRVPSSPLSEEEIFINYQREMKETGVYYGIARGPYVSKMPILDKLKVIVQVRDPRDCITSAYFSFKKSHVPPQDRQKLKEFMAEREELQALDINQFALLYVSGYVNRLRILREIIERHDDLLVLTYEDMVEHTEIWLEQIAQFVGQTITPDLRTKLETKLNFTVSHEDESKHKRQVSPGDYKQKLSSATISSKTHKLSDEMGRFGYL